MRAAIFTLLAVSAAAAADEQQLALSLRAQTDFDRVALPAAPPLRDIAACIQSQAALLPVAPPEEQPVVHFRKGYCTLAHAAIAGEPATYRAAAAEFQLALDAWPARAAIVARKKQPAEPESSGLRVLAQIARWKAGDAAPDAAEHELAAAVAARACPAGVMAGVRCEAALGLGVQWEGWMALRRDDLEAAARDFSVSAAPGWAAWVAGLQAFRRGEYGAAAQAYRTAVSDWDAARGQDPPPLLYRLAPPADLGQAYTELGGAQLLAGDPSTAIASLSRAVRESPANARALYLRARARENAGQSDAALADLSLASRTAFANAQDLASGEAHLYRGILLYLRRQYAQAEDEFASALNFEIPGTMRADASAWRRLAAVASGSCAAGRSDLEQALPAVSPYFPRQEARQALAACARPPARP